MYVLTLFKRILKIRDKYFWIIIVASISLIASNWLGYYENRNITIPTPADYHIAQGILVVKSVKGGVLIKLKQSDGQLHHYSCRLRDFSLGAREGCSLGDYKKSDIQGKAAQIVWYRVGGLWNLNRPNFLALSVDGKVIISADERIRGLNRLKARGIGVKLFLTFFYVLIFGLLAGLVLTRQLNVEKV